MSSREEFEAWMAAEQWFHGSDFEWDDRRNCYSQLGIHLAYKAWQAATKRAEAKCAGLLEELEAKDKRIDILRQDKDKVIDMSIERVNKLLSRAEAAEKRIAELEARSVKLPSDLQWSYNDGASKGEVYAFNNGIDACRVALHNQGVNVFDKNALNEHAAGITVKGE